MVEAVQRSTVVANTQVVQVTQVMLHSKHSKLVDYNFSRAVNVKFND